ncbi:hypothetical protein NliqN6_6541 [Naganishia liquefaciens]|uniref:Uncharacterized protein n=1 Tax=Naganishia liquefaciens TaxID=104408 RepID=A0A8H3U1L0_9TREE|nr:hypothetical protein NliqN6_6541 [Naganishia liquefaciens]
MQNPALLQHGPAATMLVPHDPLKPHSASSIPPTFILVILCIVIGIPSYLVYQGAFKTTEDSLENKIQKPDESHSAAAGEKKEKKRDVDDPAPPLDLQDLQGLGGLVGLAALIVMAFALFPEELNTMLGGLTPSLSAFSSSASLPVVPPGTPPIPPDNPTMGVPTYEDESRLSDREYFAEEGILPSWVEDLPEEQWYEHKSTKEIMLTCRIKPWLCDEDGLPVIKRSKPKRTRMPHTRVIQETRSTNAIVTDAAVLGTPDTPTISKQHVSFLEQHMAVLRTQPILMLPYDEDSVIDMTRAVIILLLVSPIPLLYAFGELLYNAGLVEDKARREDKKLGLERRAEKEYTSNENRAAVAKAKVRRYKDEIKQLEAADDLQHGWRDEFLKRPWWAGSNWKPDEAMVEKSKRLWRKERQTGMPAYDFEDGDVNKPRRRDVNARAFKLDFEAEMEEAKAQRHEAENEKILAKYPKDQAAKDEHPFRGLTNTLWYKSDRSGEERARDGEAKRDGTAGEVETRVNLNLKVDEARDKYRRMTKDRDRGVKESVRRNQAKIDPIAGYWKREGEIEQKEREESRWTSNRYKDPDPTSEYYNRGITKIERLDKRARRLKEDLEPKWEKEEIKDEEAVRMTWKLSPADARARFEKQVTRLEPDKVEHWLKRLQKKRDRNEHEEVYLDVLREDWQKRNRKMEERRAKLQSSQQRQQTAAHAGAQTNAPDAGTATPAKPKGFFAKALDKVGKA